MPKSKLKGMKVIRSGTTTNALASNDCPHKSFSLPDTQPHCSNHSSSTDSNQNDEDVNRDDNNILEHVEMGTATFNVNTVDSTGRHTKRGRTTLKELWALPPEEKVLVSANHLAQPIGPEAQLLSSFLGMLARSNQRIGVQYDSWHKVPKTLKEELLNFIELRFVLQIPKDYVLKSLGKKWRDYKHGLKKRHFKRKHGRHANKEKHPEGTIKWQWEELVDFWYSKKGEESEKVGIESRKQQKYTHTSGSKSFARKVKEMEISSGRKIGRLEFFKATHTKKDGSHVSEETQQILEKANEKLSEYEIMDGDEERVETQILNQVIGKERHGRVRGLGLGPTPRSFYGYSSSCGTTASTGHSTQCRDRYQEMEQRLHQMEQERQQERLEREQERLEREQERLERQRERAEYNNLLAFMRNQFPRLPITDIGGSTSQS